MRIRCSGTCSAAVARRRVTGLVPPRRRTRTMARQDSPGDEPLRMSAEAFRAWQEAGESSLVLDVRGPRDWDLSDAKILGALRTYPEIRIDPSWPKDRLILAY